MKILVVEDDPTSRLLLQRLLEPYGKVNAAVNGRDGLAAFHLAMVQGKPYDLVCLDIMMPEMDGHQALAEIRRMETGWHHAKIIMTTALADVDNLARAIQHQCDDYIVKPITKDVLIRKLRSLELL